MSNQPTVDRKQIRIPHLSPRIAWAGIGVVAVLVIALCIFYLAHTHTYLVRWFLSLNEDIPHRSEWPVRFFSPATKKAGNVFCGLALPICLFLLYTAAKQLRIRRQPAYYSLPARDLLLLGALAVLIIALWCWGQPLAAIGSDEMFSAYYSAGGHPFQTISYYMDPNNHLLFNLLNRMVFWGAADKLFTGRIISLGACIALVWLLYLWLKELTQSRLIALLITVTLSVQFQVAGFAQLARGYELYLLFQWMAFIAGYLYWKHKTTNYLLWYLLANAAGFFTIPTHLYFFITLNLVALILQLRDRKIDLLFWRYTLLSLLLTFLLYLPAILFSGLQAITANEYVSARDGFEIALLKNLGPIVQECFWINYPNRELIYGLLGLLPLSLLFLQRGRDKTFIWWCYLLIWPVYFVIAIAMKHYANMRNLIWQEQFSLCALLLTLFYCSRWLDAKLRSRWINKIAYPVILLAVTGHFLIFFPWQIDYALYGISTRKHNDEVVAVIRTLPPDAVLACPDFAISWYYLAKEADRKAVTQCTGKEPVLVVNVLDILPDTRFPGYKFWKRESFYHLYVRQDLELPLK